MTVAPLLRPIYLFADSQLLFWKIGGRPFLESVKDTSLGREPRAAYIGASNGDAPEYYAIFEAAMEGIGVDDRRMIRSSLPQEDAEFLAGADIILLAGGDVSRGWKVLGETGMTKLIFDRYNAGATLIGISAGAMLLGRCAIITGGDVSELLDTFKLVPFVIGAHDEGNNWSSLVNVVRTLEGSARGIGIPFGAGMICHANQSIEAIRHPLHDFAFVQGVLTSGLLFPG